LKLECRFEVETGAPVVILKMLKREKSVAFISVYQLFGISGKCDKIEKRLHKQTKIKGALRFS